MIAPGDSGRARFAIAVSRPSFLLAAICFVGTSATFGYYRTYAVYGTGDNVITTFCAHGGPGASNAERKWNVECLDGEAVIGILDNANDYQSLANIWCKFIFPYKPPTNGIYPYYPNCFTKNFTTQFFCYTPRFHEPSVDTFVTAFWDDDFAFNIYRVVADDRSPYKCCKAPTGYYVDYSSCYYQPTHDQYWEYYDSPIYFLVTCATGYVVTGIAKKVNPYTTEYHVEWIQCCRIGFGSRPNIPPPPINYDYYSPTNTSTYSSGYEKPRPGGVSSLYGGAVGRALREDSDGTFRTSKDMQQLAAQSGKISVIASQTY